MITPWRALFGGCLLLLMSGCGVDKGPATATSIAGPLETPSLPAPTATHYASPIGPSAIYLVESNGNNLREVAPGVNPQFSADGRYLSFVQFEGNQEALILMDRQSEEMIRLVLPRTEMEYAWSPDSRYVAISVRRESDFELLLVTVESLEISTIASAGIARYLAWSPDSRFVSWVDSSSSGSEAATAEPDEYAITNSELIAYEIDSQQVTAIVTWAGMIYSPAWASGSSQIAFTTDHGTNCSPCGDQDRQFGTLHLVSLNTSQSKVLAEVEGTISNIAWEPDGGRGAYLETNNRGLMRLHLLNATTAQEVFGADVGLSFGLLWSPDGRYIVEGGVTQVTIIDTEDFSQKTLIGGVASYTPEGWSAEGTKLVVSTMCCGLGGFIYVNIHKPGTVHSVDDTLTGNQAFTTEDPVWAPDADLIAFSGFRGCRCP